LGWVRTHWEKKYIVMAEKSIRELVRLVFIILNGASSAAPKMGQYREKDTTSEHAEQSAQTTVRSPVSNLYGGRDLDLQYGIQMEMGIGATDETVQTVEQEYQAYVTGALSSSHVDILKFWEVNGNVIL
jgi:hypothetical protein